MNEFRYEQATDASSAVSLFGGTAHARYLGGGTNLVDLMRERLPDSPSVYEFMKRVEQKLNTLIQHEGLALSDDLNPLILSEDVKELARENRKIEAVQLHRHHTGGGLAEAKRVIDEFIRDFKGKL